MRKYTAPLFKNFGATALAALTYFGVAELAGIHDGRAAQVSMFTLVFNLTALVLSAVITRDCKKTDQIMGPIAWSTIAVSATIGGVVLFAGVIVTPPMAWIAITAFTLNAYCCTSCCI